MLKLLVYFGNNVEYLCFHIFVVNDLKLFCSVCSFPPLDSSLAFYLGLHISCN